jgi:hypothetical protein
MQGVEKLIVAIEGRGGAMLRPETRHAVDRLSLQMLWEMMNLQALLEKSSDAAPSGRPRVRDCRVARVLSPR